MTIDELPELPLEALKTFYFVNKSKSLAEAAATLKLTQPAVSQHLKKLEAHFGRSLYGYKGRHKTLTKDGEVLSARTAPLFAGLEQEIHLYSLHLQEPQFLSLRVGGRKEILGHLMGELSWPQGCHFMSKTGAEVVDLLQQRQLDIGISATLPDSADLIAKPLFEFQPVFCISRSLCRKPNLPITKKLILETPCILYKTEAPFLREFCDLYGVPLKDLKTKYIVEDWNLLVGQVETSKAWSVIPSSVSIKNRAVVTKTLPRKSFPSRTFYLVLHQDLLDIPSVKSFWQSLPPVKKIKI